MNTSIPHHDITEILLKVALNTINKTKPTCSIPNRKVGPKEVWFF
jgi:hypothetical protein